MQNKILAKSIVKQLIQNVAKKIPVADLQRLSDLYILIDRLEDQTQPSDACLPHTTQPTNVATQYPEMWSQRTKLRPKRTTFKN